MKRILAVFLAIVMMFSLVACGGGGEDEAKAEKYCWNCGEGITKNATFCEHCGTEINATSEENHSDTPSSNNTSSPASKPAENTPTASSKPATNTPATSGKPATNTPTVTSKPSTHTHSYSKKVTAATCTAQGYTTYTCSCGDTYKDNYTKSSHSYTQYKCTKCGAVDKSHAYEYLIEWVKTNGTYKNGQYEYIFQGRNNAADRYGLTYTLDNEYLSVWKFDATSGYSSYTAIYLDIYYYGFSFADDTIYGYIKAGSYNPNASLTYKSSDCSVLSPEQLLPTAKSAIDLTLTLFKNFLTNNKLGITLADLGFEAF
ncbi:MAG: zinc-ribbon domain-containing protein [Ruminococcaceae bacterium]|nr:zinc-ribbon domain-containing protein [Oscillospiraceae bacterium]